MNCLQLSERRHQVPLLFDAYHPSQLPNFQNRVRGLKLSFKQLHVLQTLYCLCLTYIEIIRKLSDSRAFSLRQLQRDPSCGRSGYNNLCAHCQGLQMFHIFRNTRRRAVTSPFSFFFSKSRSFSSAHTDTCYFTKSAHPRKLAQKQHCLLEYFLSTLEIILAKKVQ